MPLTRGEIVGYDEKRMAYKFTMMNGLKSVDCEISGTALGDLVRNRWPTVQTSDRNEQFLEFRDLIEQIASDLFEDYAAGPVQIYAKHLPGDKGFRARLKR